MQGRHAAGSLTVAALVISPVALAQAPNAGATDPSDPAGLVEEIEVRAPLSPPAEGAVQVTVVPVDARLPGSADVATAVSRAPGATVTRLGGVGALSTVGIRGSASNQVEVLLDGIPLNPDGGGAVDLSELPLRAFERVEIYRGAAPPELGSVAVGGVVQLVTGQGRTTASLGGGSFGTGRATVTVADAFERGGLWLAVDGVTTGGGFEFLDQGGTRLDPSDDWLVRRTNNDVRQLAAHGRLHRTLRAGEISVLSAGVVKGQGVAGPTTAPAEAVRYGLIRELVSAQWDGWSRDARFRARGWGLARLESLDDPLAELGVGGADARRDQVWMGGGHGWLGAAVRDELRLDLTADVRGERATSGGAGAEVSALARAVVDGTASATIEAGGVALHPVLAGLVLADSDPEHGRTEALVLPRLAAKVNRGPASATLTAGWFARPPDLTELFGDRGARVGNPSLRPERAAQLDLGVAVDPGLWRAEAVGFVRSVRDLVTLQQTPQGLVRPENVSRAEVHGLELAADIAGDLGWLGASAAMVTATDRSGHPAYTGNQLPRVPRASAQLRAGVAPGPVDLGWDAVWMSGFALDRANFTVQPPRVIHGVTAQVHDGAEIWWLELDLRNVTHRITQDGPADPLVEGSPTLSRAIEDFAGYPLSGRSLWLTVRWTP